MHYLGIGFARELVLHHKSSQLATRAVASIDDNVARLDEVTQRLEEIANGDHDHHR